MAKNYALLPQNLKMYTQPEPLKEVKDISKNFVNGDYEREYRLPEKEQSGRRQMRCFSILVLCVGILTGALLILTMVREVQLARLRHEVEELTVNMIAITANVNTLNQKLIKAEKFANEFKTSDDTIIADDDDEGNFSIEEEDQDFDKDKPLRDSLHRLINVTTTILEDDEDDDEDYDMGENDGVESDDDGEDWYSDYDNRRKKIGTSGMMKLKPEDFTDTVVTFNAKTMTSNINEIKRLLNENPENPDIVNIALGSTEASRSEERNKRSVSSYLFKVPKMVAVESGNTVDGPANSLDSKKTANLARDVVSRTTRDSSIEEGVQRRPFIAAHFHGNTSHLSPEIHPHYHGNGLMQVPHDTPHDVWYPSPWTLASPHPRPTLSKNGHVHVHHTGVYLVYVQIYYLDSHDVISWVLHRTNPSIEGRETLLQCAQTSHSLEQTERANSCFSAAALFLKAGDYLAVRNTGGERHSLMQPEKSFIGLVKLADAEDPEQEF